MSLSHTQADERKQTDTHKKETSDERNDKFPKERHPEDLLVTFSRDALLITDTQVRERHVREVCRVSHHHVRRHVCVDVCRHVCR